MSCCAACASSPSSPPCGASASRRDSADLHAAMVFGDRGAAEAYAQRHGIAAPRQMGDLLPSFVFPRDVTAAIGKLDPHFRATDASVSACTGARGEFPLASVRAWTDFNSSWRKLADAGVSLFASWEAQLESVKRFEGELADWQEKIEAAGCKLSTPRLSVPGSGFPLVPVLLGVGALAVVGALGYSFYRAGSQAAGRARKGREYLESAVDSRIEAAAKRGASTSSSRALARR